MYFTNRKYIYKRRQKNIVYIDKKDVFFVNCFDMF